MVANSGPGWRLAPSLIALVAECDRRAPNRSTASDGSIGDDDHASRTSDHNPDASGDVLAVDITDDKANGCDADALAHHLVANRDPRLKYVIWNDTIVKSYVSSRGPAWVPQDYTGQNPHVTHTHVSIHDTAPAKADTSPWWPTQGEPDMPLTPADLDQIRAAVKEQVLDIVRKEGISGGVADLVTRTAPSGGISKADVEDAVKQALREGTG